jgi:Do/DeqQ family serine protease
MRGEMSQKPKLNMFVGVVCVLFWGIGLLQDGIPGSGMTLSVFAKETSPVSGHGDQQDILKTPSRDVSLLSAELVRIAKLTQASVVNIMTVGNFQDEGSLDSPPSSRKYFDSDPGAPGQTPMDPREQGMASGVIISADGYILTNNHVVEGGNDIRVLLTDQRRLKAKVVGTDPKTDLAVLKIQASGLPFLIWGDSTSLQVGEIVVAVGNPFGLNQTVTMGIISAVSRANMGIVDFEDFIQTDAAINPGNSGGALVNLKGELIGINTAIFSQSGGSMGIGFAIPSQMAKKVSSLLMTKGKVVRGWLGISMQDMTPALAKQFKAPDAKGVLLGDVTEGGPAERAKIERGDIIRKFNGQMVANPQQLRGLVADTIPGVVVEIGILRNGREQEMAVTMGELPRFIAPPSFSRQAVGHHLMDGVIVEPLPPGQGQGDEGVVVSDVPPNSPSEHGGLQVGDVLIEINRKAVRFLKDFETLSKQLGPKENVLLLVRRGGATLFLTLENE